MSPRKRIAMAWMQLVFWAPAPKDPPELCAKIVSALTAVAYIWLKADAKLAVINHGNGTFSYNPHRDAEYQAFCHAHNTIYFIHPKLPAVLKWLRIIP